MEKFDPIYKVEEAAAQIILSVSNKTPVFDFIPGFRFSYSIFEKD